MVTKSEMTVDSISDTHRTHKGSEDEKTECSTPFCSPERESAAGKLKQEHEQDEHDNPPSPVSSSSPSPTKSPSTTAHETSSSVTSIKVKEESSAEDYKNWPMAEIKEPSANDVLYGRGGGTNHHEGNKRYRKMVELRKVDYVNSKRLDKPLVALDIIRQWRDQKPPGRFLKLNEASGLWSDVGDKKAREKTSQALREKAPLLRKQQEELMRENAPIPINNSNDSSYTTEQTKTTRFNIPEKAAKANKSINRGMLTRDHSLGREFVTADEPISIKGFSWDAADNAANDSPSDDPPPLPQASSWHSGYNHGQGGGTHPRQQRPMQKYGFGSYMPVTGIPPPVPPPSGRNPHGRQHSLSMNPLHAASADIHASNSFTEGYPQTPSHSGPSHRWSQHPGYPQPSPPRSDDRLQAEWAKFRYGENDGDYRQTRSAESDYRSRSQPWHHSSSHGHDRVNSDDYTNNRYNHSHPPPPNSDNGYMQRPYDGGYNNNDRYQQYPGDNNSMNSMQQQPPPGSYNHQGGMDWSSPTRSPESMPYSNDQPQMQPQNSMMSNYNSSGMNPGYGSGDGRGYMDGGGYRTNPMMNGNSPSSVSLSRSLETSGSNVSSPSRSLPRPQNIKRDTSHQCENDETKSNVKRMNRQRSIGNTGSMSSLNEVSEVDMMNLGSHFRQSSIGQVDDMGVGGGDEMHPLRRPTPLKSNDRIPTIDTFQLGLDGASSPLDETGANAKLARPQPLGGGHRGSSVASIQIEDIAGIINKPSSLNNNDRGSTFGSLDQDLLNHVAI